MKKQEMLDYIYERIANKELTFGCRFINYYNKNYIETVISKVQGGNFYAKFDTNNGIETHFPHVTQIDKIIGHPVMIGNILAFLGEDINPAKGSSFDLISKILLKWENKEYPIEDQNDLCIEYVFNLIK